MKKAKRILRSGESNPGRPRDRRKYLTTILLRIHKEFKTTVEKHPQTSHFYHQNHSFSLFLFDFLMKKKGKRRFFLSCILISTCLLIVFGVAVTSVAILNLSKLSNKSHFRGNGLKAKANEEKKVLTIFTTVLEADVYFSIIVFM